MSSATNFIRFLFKFKWSAAISCEGFFSSNFAFLWSGVSFQLNVTFFPGPFFKRLLPFTHKNTPGWFWANKWLSCSSFSKLVSMFLSFHPVWPGTHINFTMLCSASSWRLIKHSQSSLKSIRFEESAFRAASLSERVRSRLAMYTLPQYTLQWVWNLSHIYEVKFCSRKHPYAGDICLLVPVYACQLAFVCHGL